jgi:hypothetical protein
MRLIRKTATVSALVIACAGGAWLGEASGTTTAPLIGGAHPVTSTIYIDSGDTFAAPPAKAHPRLTAIAAWRRYTRVLGHPQTRPATSIKMWIGLFTSRNEVTNRLAYGYEDKRTSGCITTLPTSKPRQCHQWTFIAANTGRGLGSRQQVVR